MLPQVTSVKKPGGDSIFTENFMKVRIILILFFLLTVSSLFASQFEELDKPPEGAHEGQMLLGGFMSIGFPFGSTIDAENNFVKNNAYQFEDNEITKELLVTHLSYDFGLSFEYMPIDHIGAKLKLKRVIIVQRTRFGSDFQNWNETLYTNYSILLGPSFHLTTRKTWDVTFTPVLGYSLAKYKAAPIVRELREDNITGSSSRDVNGLTYGAELNLTIYFSGGLFLSLGTDLNCYPLKFSPSLDLANSSTAIPNTMNSSSGKLNTMNLILSFGYAFSN